uniref:Uncharacterized protein n=1 Tax=Janibacter limosus TaxID=53458 RepID=A0AC61U366_9MICO|nr:hypothetical protein [Janibacter limosus]
MRRRPLLAAVPLVLTLGPAAGCSGSGDATPPKQALETARTTFVDAGTVGFDLKQSALPKGRNGVSAAQGSGVIDKTTPKFRGQSPVSSTATRPASRSSPSTPRRGCPSSPRTSTLST